MAAKSKLLTIAPFKFLRSKPTKIPRVSTNPLQVHGSIEEERVLHYNPKSFYPIQLHSILNDRYEIAAKIGWGTSSTVWLARDLHQ